jgi:choline monooxygenase
MEDHYNIFVGSNAYGQATKTFAPSTTVEGKSPPQIPDYPHHLRGHGEYPIFFPSLMLGTQATEFFAVSCEPLGPELTRERFYMFFPEAAMTDEFAKVREAVLQRWFDVNVEDIDVVERMQQGRHSKARAGNLFAPDLEACVHQFAKQVAAAILEGERVSDATRRKSSLAAE